MSRAANIAAFLAVVLVVMGVGGVHTAIAGGAATLALLAACLQVAHMHRRGHDTVLVSAVGIALFFAAALCLVQIVPLPALLHGLANPLGGELYARGVELSGLSSPGWRPLSLDPAATADRAIRYIALAATAVWAANVRTRHAWRTFAIGFVALGLVDLAVGVTLHQLDVKSFLGLYEPIVGFRGPSTFVSTNHGAAFFGLVAMAAAATAFSLRRERAMGAAGLALASVVAAGAAVALRSDGVVVTLALTTLVAAWYRWSRLGRPGTPRRDVAIGMALLAGIALVAIWWLDLHTLTWAFLDRVLFSGEHGGRLELLRAGSVALGDFWRFGAGAGAIETVIPAYIDWNVLIPAAIPLIENDTMEVLLSFGVPAALVMFACGAVQLWALRGPAGDGTRSPRYTVALVTAFYLVIIAQMHFPLFALGISLPAIAWLELLWSRRTKPTEGRHIFETGHVALPWRSAFGLILALGVAMLIAAQGHYAGFAPDDRAIGTDDGALARAIWLRPAHHVPYVRLATRRALDGEASAALALADHAVSREPSPRVRLHRARVLARVDRVASTKAYAELFAQGHRDGRFTAWFVTDVRATADRLEVVDPYPEMWSAITRRILTVDGGEAASSFVVGLVDRHPDDVRVLRLAATTYLEMGQPILSELWAELVGEAEARQDSPEHQSAVLLARALRASGRTDEAQRVLREATADPLATADVHRVALELRGAPNAAAMPEVQRHYDALCVSPIPASELHLCWLTEAWLAESRTEYEEAKHVLLRLRRRLGDAVPLAALYHRAGRCDQLQSLYLELERGTQRALVEALAKTCR